MFKVPNRYRITSGILASDESIGNNGAFMIPLPPRVLFAVASDAGGWEHVSVSSDRMPSWEEMCKIKDLFWGEEDCVAQFHPPKSDYVNCHPRCLHLWRQVGAEFPRPPSWMVGPISPPSY